MGFMGSAAKDQLVMCWLGLEATGHTWLELASGSGLGFCKPEAMAQAMACVTIQ